MFSIIIDFSAKIDYNLKLRFVDFYVHVFKC